MIFGPDVSDFQGTVDWPAVRAAGRLFGLAKATEGQTFVAETFTANRQGMADAGLILRGIYHFARPDRNGAQAEAEHFLATIGGLLPGEVAVLDIEVGNIGLDETGAWALAWLEAVEAATGRTPWVYSYAPFLAEMATASLTRFPLWIAGYGLNNGEVPSEAFRPGTDRWDRAVLWQYTSEATVPGVTGRCDDNVFEGTETELAALAAGSSAHLDGWEEIDRYLAQEGVAINRPAEDWQTTGGVHAPTSWHYAGRARDYSYGTGCDEAAVVAFLRPFAVPSGPIIELFHAATGTWLSDGQYVNVGGHTDHAHAAIRPGAVLPISTPPPPIPPPEEPEVAKPVVAFTVESGTRRRLPIPAIGGGFEWTKVSVTYASAGVEVLLAVVGPSGRPMSIDPSGVETARWFDGRGYDDLLPGDQWLDIELAVQGHGMLDLIVEASDESLP